jgi:nicotinamidase-related amidase
MKEIYYSPENIQRTAEGMLQGVEALRARHLPLNLPDRSALLVLDMQEYFLDPDSHAFVPSAPAIIPGIQKLISAYEGSNRFVRFTRHINDSLNAGKMATWWRDMITGSNPLSQISPHFDSVDKHILIKHQYDAFLDSGLEEQLFRESIEHVVVCGVMTHLCCETTARSAFMRGYDVWFAVDGSATYNRDYHQASLLNLSHGFAVPVLVNEVLALLKYEK